MTLKLPDSGAGASADGRRHAPSAARNAGPILAVMQRVAPAEGRLLEIASGTGQHAAEFAAALPGLDWHPTDLDPENLASIRAWTAFSGSPNLRPPQALDAAVPGWSQAHGQWDVILLVNLLHLISQSAASTVLSEISRALAPAGVALIYGPFLRDGKTTSDGDAAFDASLREQDADIGYKDVAWAKAEFARAGLSVDVEPMPANNLMLIARRPA